MKFSFALDRTIRSGIKIRREWWHEYEFVFYAGLPDIIPEPGCMKYYITRVGDKYDDIYPINTTLTKFPMLSVHSRKGSTMQYSPEPNDCIAIDWKVCKNWRELNEKARERKENNYPHSKTTLTTLTLEDFERTHRGIYYYDAANK